MNNRLNELRKSLKLSQSDFGEKLGVTSAAISRLESGQRNLTEQMILAICREFNVNEDWLRTGTGEMFEELSEDEELAKYVGELIQDGDELKKNLVLTILKLDKQDWELLKSIIKKIQG